MPPLRMIPEPRTRGIPMRPALPGTPLMRSDHEHGPGADHVHRRHEHYGEVHDHGQGVHPDRLARNRPPNRAIRSTPS